ncbi:hypothetical protein quinque_000147 [Culex quinquefasciatus]
MLQGFKPHTPNAVPASNTTPTGGLSGFLNYREKAFEEDDVMELEVLKEHNISFNLPEDFKEKKCPFLPEAVHIPSPFPTLDDGRSSITSTSISPVVVPGVTRCDECNVTFETLTELETHNINYHRELPAPPAIVPEVDNVAMLNNFHAIATFLQQPANIPPLSSVPRPDVALVRNRLAARTPDSVQSNTSEDSSNGQRLKKVRCRNCRSRFSMISQLDEHMVRCKKSPRGFSPQQNQSRQGPRPRPHSAGAGRGRGYSPNAFDRTGGGVVGRNLNASYFYYMEQLKDQK